jgi:hypothetical protein
MTWLDIPRVDEPEIIDGLHLTADDVSRSMGDVAKTNRLFGGTQTIVSHMARLLRDVPDNSTIRVLDIATGTADIPRALVAWAKRRKLHLQIIAVDNHPAMLQLALRQPDAPTLVQADALRLPFPPRSFDIAFCALAFHHLGFDASVQLLRSMDALTTKGFIVSDLRRDLPSLLGVQVSLKLLGTDPITQHDGPASVRRSWTLREFAKMTALSGVHDVHIRSSWYFRVSLVQTKQDQGKEHC